MGVLLAVFIVAGSDPSSWFGGIGTLSYTFSIIFFAWFVGIFIMLSARALPSKGNLGSDFVYVLSDGAKRLKNAFSMPNIPRLNSEDNEN